MNIPYVFKKCSHCHQWLVASTFNFNKLKKGKYGLQPRCRKCHSESNKKYNLSEKGKTRYTEYNHSKKAKEIQKIYNKSEKSKKLHKDWVNSEQGKQYMSQYWRSAKYKKYKQNYRQTPQGQVIQFNSQTKRRQRTEEQGDGVTKEQWLEMMEFFGFKCAYSGIDIGGKENKSIRSIDHIVPLAKGGAHEVWNCVPMDRSLNCSKKEKDLEEWYTQQDFYNEDRLNKINEWRKYAYNKWGKEVNTKAI